MNKRFEANSVLFSHVKSLKQGDPLQQKSSSVVDCRVCPGAGGEELVVQRVVQHEGEPGRGRARVGVHQDEEEGAAVVEQRERPGGQAEAGQVGVDVTNLKKKKLILL